LIFCFLWMLLNNHLDSMENSSHIMNSPILQTRGTVIRTGFWIMRRFHFFKGTGSRQIGCYDRDLVETLPYKMVNFEQSKWYGYHRKSVLKISLADYKHQRSFNAYSIRLTWTGWWERFVQDPYKNNRQTGRVWDRLLGQEWGIWDELHYVNYSSMEKILFSLIPHMITRRWGRVCSLLAAIFKEGI
jgi:hypothetical protein